MSLMYVCIYARGSCLRLTSIDNRCVRTDACSDRATEVGKEKRRGTDDKVKRREERRESNGKGIRTSIHIEA